MHVMCVHQTGRASNVIPARTVGSVIHAMSVPQTGPVWSASHVLRCGQVYLVNPVPRVTIGLVQLVMNARTHGLEKTVIFVRPTGWGMLVISAQEDGLDRLAMYVPTTGQGGIVT